MGVKLPLDKAQFLKDEVTFLGHLFKEHVISMNEETKRNIIDFPKPTNRKKL